MYERRRFPLYSMRVQRYRVLTFPLFLAVCVSLVDNQLWAEIQRVFKQNSGRERLERFYFEETNYNQRSVQTHVVPSGSICRSLDRTWKPLIAAWGTFLFIYLR